MGRTAFSARLGTEQGRVVSPTGWVAPEATAVFVLGNDTGGRLARLMAGDHADVHQAGDFGTGKILRCKARVRPPATPPPGNWAWTAQLLIDGTAVVSVPITRARNLSEIAWSVAGLGGSHTVTFRLQLTGSNTGTHDVELPAFYVDAVQLDPTATTPALTNRSPEPGERAIPVDASILLDIVDVTGVGVSLADTKVYVNGVLAFNGGTFQTGFTGPDSAHTAPQADTLRLVIDPTTNFTSLEDVAVRVISNTTGDLHPIDISYNFMIADVTAPTVVAASSTSETTVRVTFSEAMTAAGALDPTNYSFVRGEGAIAVPIVPVSVVQVSATEFDVTIDWEITRRAPYTVTVNNVLDTSGNAIDTNANTADFAGFVCPAPDGRDFDLLGMLAELNRDEDDTGDLTKSFAVFQEVCDLLLCRADRFTEIVDPDTAPVAFVEAMLDDLGNPFSFALSDIDKRRLARVLVSMYKQKGTDVGIINAIRFFLAIEVTIENAGWVALGLGDWQLGWDWILGSGDLGDLLTFWVHVPTTIDADTLERMTQIVDYMKRAECHFKILQPPPPPDVPDHLELGLSELGVSWILH